MPYCRTCHSKISKFDTDICPYCGTPHPIDPNYETMDITRGFASLQGQQYDLPKAKKRKIMILLCALLGFFGAHWFYILRPKRGAVSIAISAIIVGGLGSILLVTPLPAWVGYLIAFGAIWAVYIIEAVLLCFIEAPKDGRGEFLR